jgi:hypothetical protein
MKRAESTRIWIPSCVDPQRRERCLADPELFLKTYFKDRYPRPFTKLHTAIIDALVEIATTGGEKALAAPRGRGKTEVLKGVLCYLILAGLVRFPVPISSDYRPRPRNLRGLPAEDQPERTSIRRLPRGLPPG